MLGVNDFNTMTTVRLVRHTTQPSGDYIHVTGENSGCWSYVGRRGRVSSTVQGFVKTSPALRTKPLWFCSRNPKNKSTPIYLVLPHLHLQNRVGNLRNILPELQ
jgi:hypothetical protein